MNAGDRVKSAFNTGTISKIEDDTVFLKWDGYMGDVKIPMMVAETFEVIPN